MRFQPVKCIMMQLTRKLTNKSKASYTLEDTVLENVGNIKSLGVTITNDLKWNTHISNRTLGFLKRTILLPQTCGKQLIKEWRVQSWSMEAQFGTLKLHVA